MPSNTLLLIRTFLKSTSDINVLKFPKDKAKRKYARNSLIGQTILNVIILVYATLLSVVLAKSGQALIIPETCAMLLLGMPFLFTLFKASGYLFGFKEYDMIMSMPFSVKSIIESKFWYMYIKSIPMYGFISLSMLIGYIVGGYFKVWSCIAWIVMTFAIPLIPMVLASALGAVVTKIGSGFKYKNIARAVFTIIIVMPMFFVNFFIDDSMSEEDLENMMNIVSDRISSSSSFVPFAKWFSEAVNDGVISSFLFIVASAILVYELFVFLLSKFYRKMNSQLSSGTHSKKYKLTSQKQMSMVKAVAFKEFKRMTGSSTYLVNAGIGQVMATAIGVVMLFVKPEVIIQSMMHGAPLEASMVFPAIPILIYFFLGMVPTTCCSPSLEGKNYWIMQTLPISPMDDNKGKMLFNIYMTIPFAVFATVTASICFRVSVIDAITSVIALCSLCIFSTVYGLRCGLKHRRLDFENEIEIIKQGMAVSMNIILHLILGFIFMPLVVVANYALHSVTVIMLLITLLAWIFITLAWTGVKKYTRS